MVHVFKLTKIGFLVCNGKYIKVRDEKGLVNYFGNMIQYKQEDINTALR